MPEAALQIHVDNLKCGGCANTIVKGLSALDGVSAVMVDRNRQLISMRASEGTRATVLAKLRDMGYPERDSVQGLDAALAGAKSFVSCAVGRLS